MLSQRTWQVTTVSDFDYLLHELAQTDYPACGAFRLDGLLFLNTSSPRRDRTSNRFRVIREADRTTLLWEIEVDEKPSSRTRRRLFDLLEAGATTDPDDLFPPMDIRWSDHPSHRCPLCRR